ncbi:putative membrane protein [Oopsacas minuta]|uniref:Transmembrane protein 138 n=1 Tax=Oopsacas minuta TaxID=111878 RepID=A0AAV7JNV3_9METZ|nr:putative membrane protein [Oopsacas minuta]
MLILVQHFLLFFDLLVNSIIILLLQNKIILLLFAVLQDIALLLSIALFFVSFINTSYFKAGFLLPLIRRFWLTLLITALYAILSLIFQAVFLSHTLNRPDGYKNSWSSLIQVLYVLHRSIAVLFYYAYKRTSLCICSSKFYNTDLLFNAQS